MKQYIKRVLLVLCMTVSLFSLSACSAGTETKGKELDPMTDVYKRQGTGAEVESLEGGTIQFGPSLWKAVWSFSCELVCGGELL